MTPLACSVHPSSQIPAQNFLDNHRAVVACCMPKYFPLLNTIVSWQGFKISQQQKLLLLVSTLKKFSKSRI